MDEIATVVTETAVETTAAVATVAASSPSTLVVGAAVVGAATCVCAVGYGAYKLGRWTWARFHKNTDTQPEAATTPAAAV